MIKKEDLEIAKKIINDLCDRRGFFWDGLDDDIQEDILQEIDLTIKESFWTPIDPDNLPERQVLLTYFDENGKNYGLKYWGWILNDSEGKPYYGGTGKPVTHYHDINKYDLK